nr:paired amphipathic helix protein Sin3-like 2 isoform X3 [Tanacetum cinerariifolium]
LVADKDMEIYLKLLSTYVKRFALPSIEALDYLLRANALWHDATPRPRSVHDDGHEAKSNINDVPSSQQGDTIRTSPVANGICSKFKKEEGELSPIVYFNEADLAAYGDHNRSNAKAKHSMEIDADVDDEDKPMLYVPSRPKNYDNVNDVQISTRGATRNEGESDGSLGVDSVTFNNVKQGKPACNDDDNVSPKRVDSSKVIMVNGDTLPKEDGSRVKQDVKNRY